ncbi:MAG: cation transporter [Ruminococcaceae bacterium]|nr:cation transporter [Oscillospiraceae bacterium]
MSELLLRLFIKNYNDTRSPEVRKSYGILSGTMGIVLNIVLCIGKFIVGALSNSIAITADAFNNLSDAGSSVVTLFGFKLSSKKPDKDHPFGHGRYEYISALIVSFIVLIMGFELITSSVDKIRNPEDVTFSIPTLTVLLLSIGGKIWLALFNRKLGKKIDSPALSAVVTDSIGDTVATTASLLSIVITHFTKINIDGYIGIIVACFVLYAGYGILKDTISPLLGEPPDKEIVKQLVEYITSYDDVMGIHDLVLHNYGANSIFGTVHVEVSVDSDIVQIHDTIDCIEQEVYERLGIHLVIHLDPLVFNDEKVNSLRSMVVGIVTDIDERLKIHDFRVVDGPTHTNMIFDLVVPYDFRYTNSEITEIVKSRVSEIDSSYYVVMLVETDYI